MPDVTKVLNIFKSATKSTFDQMAWGPNSLLASTMPQDIASATPFVNGGLVVSNMLRNAFSSPLGMMNPIRTFGFV